MQAVTTIGLDIAKSVFQVHGVNAAGQLLIRRQLKRRAVLAFFRKLSVCLVGIEACASSHYWSRELQALGHSVRLTAARREWLEEDRAMRNWLPQPAGYSFRRHRERLGGNGWSNGSRGADNCNSQPIYLCHTPADLGSRGQANTAAGPCRNWSANSPGRSSRK